MNESLARILGRGVVATIRASSSDGLLEAAEAIVAGGIDVVEFTLTTPDALHLIATARARLADRALVGAGTVLDAGDLRAALAAKAQFIVMPTIDRGAVEAAQAAGVPIIPGALTPTEVLTAWQWGADLVKLFPASVGGPDYVKAILGPLPHVRLVPTGGVSAANAAEYIRAGAAAVAVGGNLVDRNAIAAREFDRLTTVAGELVTAVNLARRAD